MLSNVLVLQKISAQATKINEQRQNHNACLLTQKREETLIYENSAIFFSSLINNYKMHAM